MDQIPITRKAYRELKALYKANKDKSSIRWEGRDILTNYAKYVLEYMEMELHIKPSKGSGQARQEMPR